MYRVLTRRGASLEMKRAPGQAAQGVAALFAACPEVRLETVAGTGFRSDDRRARDAGAAAKSCGYLASARTPPSQATTSTTLPGVSSATPKAVHAG